jgi:hypothetical protein
MAQHGYLREYDEGWDRGDDRDRDRERGWRDEDREHGWRGSGGEWSQHDRGWHGEDRDPNERNRNFMLGDRNRSWERGSDWDQDRGFFGRAGDQARSWFRDDERGTQQRDRGSSGYGREHGFGGFQGDYSRSSRDQGGFGGRGDWERSPRNFSSHQDDHYRSWRDRQMSALDRDYEDYCREREQQFHQDFDSWRRNRQNKGLSGQSQMQSSADRQQGKQASSEEVMELDNPTGASAAQQSVSSPTADATLGTNNSENTARGRR